MTEPMEIYPMAMFPTFSMGDVAASVEWYTGKVGFASLFSMPGPGGGIAMAHLWWRKYLDLLLVPDAGPSDTGQPKGVGVVLSFSGGLHAGGRYGRRACFAGGGKRGGTRHSALERAGASSCSTPTGIGWCSLRQWMFPGALRT